MKLHRRISENTKYLSKLEKEVLKLLFEHKQLFTYGTFTIAHIS